MALPSPSEDKAKRTGLATSLWKERRSPRYLNKGSTANDDREGACSRLHRGAGALCAWRSTGVLLDAYIFVA